MNSSGSKKYYTIGEVSDMLSVASHSLRFWESKFSAINPKKTRGRRYYSHEQIEKLRRIKNLLYEKKYSLNQVAEILKQESSSSGKSKSRKDSEDNQNSRLASSGKNENKYTARVHQNEEQEKTLSQNLVQKIELSSKTNASNAEENQSGYTKSKYEPDESSEYLTQGEFDIEPTFRSTRSIDELLAKLYSLRAKLS